MKIKEIEIKNSKTHALVYINPWGRAVIQAYILQNSVPYAVIHVIMLFSTDHKIEVFKS